ncbi:condensation domain-containing protein [Plantactinospora soyae]|uniref:Condensation domain-containing protein n=1 Tax=Plantactinospora soyae TaxID=1544732 RepID=A0A927RB58_9ACTN|nr:condensation domain-containing protein [Plantactinospora soyae]MBE1491341.1 hypothetical protein [Plantactinospora soyae]
MTSQVDVQQSYPLSPVQRGILRQALAEPGPSPTSYLEQVRLIVRGRLRVADFQLAWSRVIARHATLRTGFVWHGIEEPVQVVVPTAPAPEWYVDDLRNTRACQRRRGLAEFLATDRARGFVLTAPPLSRFALLRVSETEHLFVWTAHHLVIDGWSFPILLREALEEYRAAIEGRDAALPAPAPFRDHVAWLARRDLTGAEEFWRAELAGRSAPTPLPTDQPDGPADEFGPPDVSGAPDVSGVLKQSRPTGPSGTVGGSGSSGTVGGSGSAGVVGPRGASGLADIPGPTGAPGPANVFGPADAVGPRGESPVEDPFAEHRVEVSGDDTARLHETARQQRVTLETVLHGCWARLLSAHSGETDVVFGATVSCRPVEAEASQNMIGPLVNTLPVRVRIHPDEPVGAWLRQLQQHQALARPFDHVPLGRIESWTETPAGSPLFETLVDFENYPVDNDLFTGTADASTLSMRFEGRWSSSHHPLTLLVVPGERLGLHTTYDRRRLRPATVEHLLAQLTVLLVQFAADPERPLSDLSLSDREYGPAA